MAGFIAIINGFAPSFEAARSVFLPEVLQTPTAENLMGIALVANVEDQLVLGKVENPVEGDRRFDHAEVGREVSAIKRGLFDDFLTNVM